MLSLTVLWPVLRILLTCSWHCHWIAPIWDIFLDTKVDLDNFAIPLPGNTSFDDLDPFANGQIVLF